MEGKFKKVSRFLEKGIMSIKLAKLIVADNRNIKRQTWKYHAFFSNPQCFDPLIHSSMRCG
jgi:hypothetical protein